MPIAPTAMSPLDIPTPTADPGCRGVAGGVLRGAGGACVTVMPRRAAALASAPRIGRERPRTLSGSVIGRARASSAWSARAAPPRAASVRAVEAAAGLAGVASTGVPTICSIGVASTVLPP